MVLEFTRYKVPLYIVVDDDEQFEARRGREEISSKIFYWANFEYCTKKRIFSKEQILLGDE